jgi:hypothetical protein
MSDPNVLQPGEDIKPHFDLQLAAKLIFDLYGLEAKNMKEMNRYIKHLLAIKVN